MTLCGQDLNLLSVNTMKSKKNWRKTPALLLSILESFVNKNAFHVNIYGTIKDPFDIVQNNLMIPFNKWPDCFAAPLDDLRCQ